MKYLLLVMFFSVISQAYAQKLPWANTCGRVISFKESGILQPSINQHAWITTGWHEIEVQLAEHMRKPGLEVSMEYVNYRAGDLVMTQAEYAPDCKSFKEDDEKTKALFAKSQAGTLTRDDLKGPRWIHLMQAMNKIEDNCLALSKVNGLYSGCADQWQDGLTQDELVCFKGKTYMKCHVECMETIYKTDVKTQPGPCPEVE
jgi:hypothetical protein